MIHLIKGKQAFKKKCSQPQTTHHFKKAFWKNLHFDTRGILTLTKKQCMHHRYRSDKKKFPPVFYRFIQLTTTRKKIAMYEWNIQQKNIGTAYSLKTYFITFKIVQL